MRYKEKNRGHPYVSQVLCVTGSMRPIIWPCRHHDLVMYGRVRCHQVESTNSRTNV
jgi:hypothetical protein